jgi:hypothetical protein
VEKEQKYYPQNSLDQCITVFFFISKFYSHWVKYIGEKNINIQDQKARSEWKKYYMSIVDQNKEPDHQFNKLIM